jgi:hypothetical protein
MLSDACADFLFALDRGVPVKQAAKDLLEGVNWYGKPDYEYPPYQIKTLRQAAKAVLAKPDDFALAEWLVSLADCVRGLHDYYWGIWEDNPNLHEYVRGRFAWGWAEPKEQIERLEQQLIRWKRRRDLELALKAQPEEEPEAMDVAAD